MATCLDAVELLVDRFEALRKMPLFEALQWKDHTRLHLQLPRYQHITRGSQNRSHSADRGNSADFGS